MGNALSALVTVATSDKYSAPSSSAFGEPRARQTPETPPDVGIQIVVVSEGTE